MAGHAPARCLLRRAAPLPGLLLGATLAWGGELAAETDAGAAAAAPQPQDGLVIDAALAPVGLSAPTPVGETTVPGIGRVQVEAATAAGALTLQARDATGRLIGQANTVIGLDESEVYIRGADGLLRLLIRWPAPPP
jgi:hypothetical protein